MSLKKNNPKITDFKLIVGLGNPGQKYRNTPHNAGFLFIDELKNKLEYQFHETNKKEYSLTTYPTLDLQLLKPLTYMNNSGQVLARLLKYNEYKAKEILIVHDDLDIDLGKYKLQFSKYPKSHNGIISIHQSTNKTKFWYLRIGIETRSEEDKRKISGEKYVLKKLAKDNLKTLKDTINKSIKELI